MAVARPTYLLWGRQKCIVSVKLTVFRVRGSLCKRRPVSGKRRRCDCTQVGVLLPMTLCVNPLFTTVSLLRSILDGLGKNSTHAVTTESSTGAWGAFRYAPTSWIASIIYL